MQTLVAGQRLKLEACVDPQQEFSVEMQYTAPFSLDIACFGVTAEQKLYDDAYLVFFNQLQTPCKAVTVSLSATTALFKFNLNKLPAAVERLVCTATIDGNGTMHALQQGQARFIQGAQAKAEYTFRGSDFSNEKAILVCEIYRKDGIWRVSALGQGFNGGLSALLKHFGGEEAPANQTPVPAPAASSVVLSKAERIAQEVQVKAPVLVSLVKAAKVSLDKQGLQNHTARVCLVLDISGSMVSMYRTGKVQQIVERILALACVFDDDQSLDVFLFDSRAIAAGTIDLNNFQGAIDAHLKQYKLGGGTSYAPVMQLVCDHFRKQTRDIPAYVLFVTDGGPSDKAKSKMALIEAAQLPIFWKFVGIGSEQFIFLEKLDDLHGRVVDNADFFAVQDPASKSDVEMYELLMREYSQWLNAAKTQRILI